jgi:hypothetical protein
MEAVATMDNVWSQSRNLIGKNMLVKAGVCPKHTDIQLCKMPMMAEWRVYVDPCPRCVANAPASTASKNLLDPPILAHLPSNATMNIDTGACAFQGEVVGVESGPKHVSTLCKGSQSERERGERASKVVRCSKKMCPIARSRGKNSESIAFHYFGEIVAINLLVVQGSQSLVSLFSPAASGNR